MCHKVPCENIFSLEGPNCIIIQYEKSLTIQLLNESHVLCNTSKHCQIQDQPPAWVII